MQIFLRDNNQAIAAEWQSLFSDFADVNVSCGDIFAEGPWLDAEAIVSPANSFGFMDGGIDFVYSSYFGWGVSDKLRELLWTEYGGELLVGQAVVIDMRLTNPNAEHKVRIDRMPYLISAPTMRVPSDVSKTVNAYLAFVASLRVAEKQGIKSILCPGLGTAIGRLSPQGCAIQMYEAYKHYNRPRFFDILANAHRLHYSMLTPATYLGSEAIGVK